jgi:hypothetical protein
MKRMIGIHANIIMGTFEKMVGLLPLEIHLLQLDIGSGLLTSKL